MRKELPVRPNLEHLKSQAKDLLSAFRRKEREAIDRFRDALPAAGGASHDKLAAMELALHDAQSVIAREYGFASWADLRSHIEDAPKATSETLRALMDPHLGAPLPSEVQQALLAAMSGEQPKDGPLPSSLPLVPLRNALLPVGAVAPLSIGRAASIAAIEAARGGGEIIALFAQKDVANEAPTEADLHPVGCAARLLAVVTTPDRGMWIVVRATQWIRLEAIERRDPYLTARFARFEVQEEAEESDEVKRLEQALRERVRAFAAKLPDPELILRRTERMSAPELADAAIANLPCSVDEKARYAGEPSLAARMTYVLSLIDRAA